MKIVAGTQDVFDKAEFYDCCQQDRLTHMEVADAVEELLDGAWEKDKSVKQVLDEVLPVEVNAHDHKKKSPKFIEGMGRELLEGLSDDFYEEFGDPDGDHELWAKRDRKTLIDSFDAVIAEAYRMMDVWQCDCVASAVFDEDDLRNLLPDWFSSMEGGVTS